MRLLSGKMLFVCFIYLSFAPFVLSYNPFDDSILYEVSWAGQPTRLPQNDNDDPVFITTKENEKYRCALPVIRQDLQDEYKPGPSSSPDELLKPLSTTTRCSYRLEAYWAYELCHGSHIRQYHEERPLKSKPTQEYILGMVSPEEADKHKEKPESLAETIDKNENEKNVRTRNFNGRKIPYYEVVMDNGTPCELLNGKPRLTHVIYMCKPDSHNEIVSVKEIQSCEYQIEVLTPLLCASDLYKVKEDIIHQIRCHSLDNSPSQPYSYVQHILESDADRLGYREYQYMPVQGESPEEDLKNDEHRNIPPQPDQQLTTDFLNGDYCLRGGTGWWNYEYCHSKHVLQYHEDQQGKTVIYLGTWNKDIHIDWAKRHPNRKTMEHVTHYYSNGDICDVTGKARNVQVRLRCRKSEHLQEVSIYLLEPKPCQYILSVDSPILCPLVAKADENWIFPPNP